MLFLMHNLSVCNLDPICIQSIVFLKIPASKFCDAVDGTGVTKVSDKSPLSASSWAMIIKESSPGALSSQSLKKKYFLIQIWFQHWYWETCGFQSGLIGSTEAQLIINFHWTIKKSLVVISNLECLWLLPSGCYNLLTQAQLLLLSHSIQSPGW